MEATITFKVTMPEGSIDREKLEEDLPDIGKAIQYLCFKHHDGVHRMSEFEAEVKVFP